MTESHAPASSPARLTLFTLPGDMGLGISDSPPCAKVEVYFALRGLPFVSWVGNVRESPNKLVPFVRWPDGSLQAESGDIIARLEDEHRPIDALVSPARLARGKEVQRLAEEIVYDATLYDRFVRPDGAALQRPLTTLLVRNFLPASLAFLAPLGAIYVDRTQVQRALGTRMADPKTGYAAAIDCIEQIVALLGDDPYMCGAEPSTVDCSLWPHVVHAAATPNPTPLRDAPGGHPTLVAWMLRFGERVGRPLSRGRIHAD